MKPKVNPSAYYHRNVILDTLKEVVEEKGLKFKSIPKYLDAYKEWDSIHVYVGDPGQKAQGEFMLQQMPGCCAILTMSHLKTFNQRTFDIVVSHVEDAAYRAGFGSLVLTQVWEPKKGPDREPWALLLKRGWVLSDPFINAKSGNYVSYLTKNLGHAGKVAGLEEPCFEPQPGPRFGFADLR